MQAMMQARGAGDDDAGNDAGKGSRQGEQVMMQTMIKTIMQAREAGDDASLEHIKLGKAENTSNYIILRAQTNGPQWCASHKVTERSVLGTGAGVGFEVMPLTTAVFAAGNCTKVAAPQCLNSQGSQPI
eukprot:500092-Pelagomonas_calceolata.AAC.14